MESKIANHICLYNHPVEVLRADNVPEKAICFKKGKWGCVVALIKAASQGKIVAAAKETTVCMGARAGLGFQGYEHGWIEYFLSTGNDKIPHSEFYKKTPELAKIFTETIPTVEPPACLVFKPLDMVEEDEKPECIIFLVNADQLSGLTTLANYDRISQNNVQVNFASGCGQAVLYPLSAEEKGEKTCYIGMTDPSARKVISKEQMSFSIPYSRFFEMEQESDGCFFTTDTWETIKKRI